MKPLLLAIVGFIMMMTMFTVARGSSGFYLMVPPRDANHFFPQESAKRPLAQWDVGKAFDTAKECESFIAIIFKGRQEHLEEVRQKLKSAEARGEQKVISKRR